jgi:hypothetical protein
MIFPVPPPHALFPPPYRPSGGSGGGGDGGGCGALIGLVLLGALVFACLRGCSHDSSGPPDPAPVPTLDSGPSLVPNGLEMPPLPPLPAPSPAPAPVPIAPTYP